jgi:hypothetical protein
MYFSTSSLLLLLGSLAIKPSLAGYVLTDDYSGNNFFSSFDFFIGPDPTSGTVQYLDGKTASAVGLVGTLPNNQTFMAVDNVNAYATPYGRPSVRITSKKTFNHGLVIADITHMPGGICGTWPAFWMVGPNWPQDGEIDIIEGVNEQSNNQMTLHTNSGCTVDNSTDFTGSLVTTDCNVDSVGQDKNAGCGVSNANPASFGTGFNDGLGGVYVMEWTSDAINVFFFDRYHIPADITNGKPLPQYWGNPVAQFASGCDMDQHFQNLQIVFDITFCGAWAGDVWSSSSCASKAPTCEEYVANNPAAFTGAYWEIGSVKVYESQDS